VWRCGHVAAWFSAPVRRGPLWVGKRTSSDLLTCRNAPCRHSYHNRVQVIDQPALTLRAAISDVPWAQLGVHAAVESFSSARSKCTEPTAIAGAAGAVYLHALISSVEREIAAHHSTYGSVRWFWYLRRIPREFFSGGYGTTFAYDRVLAESLTWPWPQEAIRPAQFLNFPIDVAAARQIARFVGRLKLLSHLHILYRRVAKGAELDLSRRLPFAKTPPGVDKAIAIYDQRHDQGFDFAAPGIGIATLHGNEPSVDDIFNFSADSLLVTFALSEPIRVVVPFPHGEKLEIAEVDSWHAMKLMSLERVFAPLGRVEPAYLQVIAPALQLLMLLPLLFGAFRGAFAGMLQFGYFVVPHEKLATLLDESLQLANDTLRKRSSGTTWAANFADWFASAMAMKPETWPLKPGGFLRVVGAFVVVDVTAASYALLTRIEIDRSPVHGNSRALVFEDQCQGFIDKTKWKPAPELSEVRGRTLRIGGKSLTDIDALGVKAGTLLLVSCKSLIYDAGYDRGDFQVIRNAQSTVDAAVRHWAEILSVVRRTPVGDNYDFSSFQEVLGIVCAPFPVYTSTSESLELVAPGLRACASAAELDRWLSAAE
jgi:hypothetical protein